MNVKKEVKAGVLVEMHLIDKGGDPIFGNVITPIVWYGGDGEGWILSHYQKEVAKTLKRYRIFIKQGWHDASHIRVRTFKLATSEVEK